MKILDENGVAISTIPICGALCGTRVHAVVIHAEELRRLAEDLQSGTRCQQVKEWLTEDLLTKLPPPDK